MNATKLLTLLKVLLGTEQMDCYECPFYAEGTACCAIDVLKAWLET